MARPDTDGDCVEALLAECFADFDEDRHRIAHWVVTGVPADFDPSMLDPTSLMAVGLHDRLSDALAALGEGPAIGEWRLGVLLAHSPLGMGPARAGWTTGPLEALRFAHRGRGPTGERMEAALEAAGVDEVELLEELLTVERWGDACRNELRHRPLFARVVATHIEVVRARLLHDANAVESVADALAAVPPSVLEALAETIAGMTADPSRKRRAAGTNLARRVPYDTLAPHYRRLVVEAAAPVRAAAIRAWSRAAGDDHLAEVAAFCGEKCSDDRSPAVRAAVEELLTDLGTGPSDDPRVLGTGDAVAGASGPVIDDGPPTDAERSAFFASFERSDRQALERYRRIRAQIDAKLVPGARHPDVLAGKPIRTDPELVEELWRRVAGTEDGEPLGRRLSWAVVSDVIDGLRPLHAFRLVRALGWDLRQSRVVGRMIEAHDATGRPSLPELQATAEAAGFARREVMAALPVPMPWPAEQICAWATALLPELEAIIEHDDGDWWDRIEKYYAAAATVADKPETLRRLLLRQGVAGTRSQRALAQSAMLGDDRLVDDLVATLGSTRHDERAGAASWLARLGARSPAEPLHAAARIERHDGALAALLTALESLGESLDEHLHRERLLEWVRRDAKKAMPPAAAWVSVESLPPLRWIDGSAVAPEIVSWFVVQAVRMKSAAPSPIVRRFFDRMEPDDVMAFADTVLALWLVEDLRPIPLDEAMERARVDARRMATSRQWYPEVDHLDDEQLIGFCLQRHLSVPAGSATTSKGLLSLVAAGGGPSVVAPTESYLRTWYGRRANQCKALVEMLAWVDDPAATQLVLSVANRFRTKGIQDEALQQAQLLADRKGWTLEDLADRTVPAGGFGSDGRLELDHGSRRFVAHLADDLSVVLRDENGKTLKALPAARMADDDELVGFAKRELATAKKQVKAAAKEQPRRIHEAMCVQRRFDVDVFEQYVLGHPVMARLAARLVWVAESGDGRVFFRPLTDGTLLGADDDEVDIGGADHVRIAHEAVDGAEAGTTWIRHLADYRVTPLFPQFGRPAVPSWEPEQTELTHMRGAIIDDRRIRSAITKAGFRLGPGEDGGAVFCVTRPFVSAGIDAELALRGLHAMILEQDVALESLSFVRTGGGGVVPLAEVPPVLLVEALAEVDGIVAAGEGIVADWEQRVPW